MVFSYNVKIMLFFHQLVGRRKFGAISHKKWFSLTCTSPRALIERDTFLGSCPGLRIRSPESNREQWEYEKFYLNIDCSADPIKSWEQIGSQ